jgi:DNA-binding PadR family transcriptional regulator
MLLMSLLATAGEMSGYQIATVLREHGPLIWPVKHNQIYPALAKLERGGDVVGQWIEQKGRPNKKEFTLSAQGKERLTQWLLSPREVYSTNEIILIVYNIALIGADAVKRALTIYRQQSESEKERLERRWTDGMRASVAQGQGTPMHLNVEKWTGVRTPYEFALLERDARIQWCDTVLARAEAVIAVAIMRGDG